MPIPFGSQPDGEMDLIIGRNEKSAILTLVERSINMLLMRKLEHGKQAFPLAKTVCDLLLPYKGDGVKTITTDNGSEFARHDWITKKIGATVYFADTYASWQKGAIENTNIFVKPSAMPNWFGHCRGEKMSVENQQTHQAVYPKRIRFQTLDR